MSWDKCIEMLNKKDNIQGTEYIALNERSSFDLNTGLPDTEYQQINEDEVKLYIDTKLSNLKYPYELDDMPEQSQLLDDINDAILAMKTRLKRIGIVPDMMVSLEVFNEEITIMNTSKTESNGTLKCRMDPRLLRRILDKSSHWNNAEIGCHIEFDRKPNYYSPDIHTALQFFHL